MKNTVRLLLALLGFVCLMLCYLCCKLYNYKQKYNELQQNIGQNSIYSNKLTPIDNMVFSGNQEAYLYCNTEYMTQHYGPYCDPNSMPLRDFLLYNYILAIRDNNLYAATDFAANYMGAIDNGDIALDTTVIREVERLLLNVVSCVPNDSICVIKFLSACKLSQIYNGEYNKYLKDTILHKQLSDTISKYANKF